MLHGYLQLHALFREAREKKGVLLRVKGWSKRDDERWRVDGDGGRQGGRKRAQGKWNRGCEISGLMEDKRGKVILNGSLVSLMKRCQNVFGSHCLHYCPQTRMPSGTICHKNPFSVFFAESLTLSHCHGSSTMPRQHGFYPKMRLS